MNNLKASKAILEYIIQEEGSRLKPYVDVRNWTTIGVGHLLHKGPITHEDQPITLEQELEYLRQDIYNTEEIIKHFVIVDLNQNQFDALVSFVFNVGDGHFIKSELLAALNKGLYNLAAQYFVEYDHAGAVVSTPLLRRREYEQTLFLTPETI